jgi:hypothetical protein
VTVGAEEADKERGKGVDEDDEEEEEEEGGMKTK